MDNAPYVVHQTCNEFTTLKPKCSQTCIIGSWVDSDLIISILAHVDVMALKKFSNKNRTPQNQNTYYSWRQELTHERSYIEI